MPETLIAPLVEAATETFESLAYLFAEPGNADDVPSGDVEGVAGITFSGPKHGGLVVQLSGGVLPVLAANMLGLDDATSASDQHDALGEAANVICGNVLPRIAGSTAVFALGVPHAYRSWHEALEALGPVAARVRLVVEGGRADVALILHPAP